MAVLISEAPIMIRDDDIAFSKNISKFNGEFYRISQAMLLTHYGFLVPLNISSMAFLDYFEDGMGRIELGERNAKALLVDWRERVYELAMTRSSAGDGIVSKMRLITGPGTRYAKASSHVEEQKAMTALDVTDSLKEAVKVLTPNLYVGHADYVVLSIPSIAEGLTKAKCTRNMPLNFVITDQDIKIRNQFLNVFCKQEEELEKK